MSVRIDHYLRSDALGRLARQQMAIVSDPLIIHLCCSNMYGWWWCLNIFIFGINLDKLQGASFSQTIVK